MNIFIQDAKLLGYQLVLAPWHQVETTFPTVQKTRGDVSPVFFSGKLGTNQPKKKVVWGDSEITVLGSWIHGRLDRTKSNMDHDHDNDHHFVDPPVGDRRTVHSFED